MKMTAGGRVALLLALFGWAACLTACQSEDKGTSATPTAPQGADLSDSSAMTETSKAGGAGASGMVSPTHVTLGLPYKPDVQFAPIYVAQEEGYFAAEGLIVDLQYGDESSFMQLVGAGKMDAVIAGGDQAIQARAADVPIRYVAAWYQRFPVAIFSDDPSLSTAESLVGHKVGLPATSGASYLGWQAFLAANKIDPSTIETEVVGFNQLEAVLQGRVDAAVGYAMNEPLRLKAEGKPVAVIEIADTFNLPSNGLVVSDDAVASRRPMVQGLTKGLLLGIRDTLDDPDRALTATMQAVPELADPAAQESARAVLRASLKFWESEFGIGVIDARSWSSSIQFLREKGIIQTVPNLADLIEQRFVMDANVQIVR